MKILVVKMSALGDVVQSLPVVHALKQGFPQSTIHWLVEEAAEPLVRSHPDVDRVLVSRREKWGRDIRDPRKWRRAGSEIRALKEQLQRKQYDLAIDLQGLLKIGLWMGLSSAHRKAGYDGTREWSHRFLSEKIKGLDFDLHAVERYLVLVEALGGRPAPARFGLSVSEKAREEARRIREADGWDPSAPYAILVPAARWETKRWGEAPFGILADRLVGELGLRVAIAGVGADRPLGEAIRMRMRGAALNLAGRTDLTTLMALLEGARVVVSTDSGPMHLAAALGTPVVAMFGPTAPWRTGPYGRQHRVVREEMACSPCFRRRCSTKQCMKNIRPEAVAEQVEDVIRDRSLGLRRGSARVEPVCSLPGRSFSGAQS